MDGYRLSQAERDAGCHISLVNRYVYVENPKTGCSTIKYRLGLLETMNSPFFADRLARHIAAKWGNVHDALASPFLFLYQLPKTFDVLHSPAFFRFSFVRNPFTRLLSAYLDKITHPTLEWRNLVARFGDIGRPSFAEFVALLGRNHEMFHFDKHWRPQHFNLMTDEITYAFIGRFENFEEDFARVAAQVAPGRTPPRADVRPHRTNAAEEIARHYAPGVEIAVAELYREDFRRFGYTPTLAGVQGSPQRVTPGT